MTRIPVGGHPYGALESRWAVAHFPLVGAALGAALAIAWHAVAGLGAFVSAALIVCASMLITGALHEDGLADTVDALGGSLDRERVFQILKDSRIGTYGAAALTLSIVLRVGLLARLETLAPAALVLCHCAARLAPVGLLAALPYVTPDAQKSRPFSGASLEQAGIAAFWVVLCAFGLVHFGMLSARTAIGAMLSVLGIGIACGAWFRARVGGITGDFLGASEQLSECGTLLAIALSGPELSHFAFHS